MTKEQTKEAIKVMQAYVDGKEIELEEVPGQWTPLPSPQFYWGQCNYRIKPEPKYRPFASAEEVMEAIRVHGDWVSHNGRYYRIIEIIDMGCAIGTDMELWKFPECVSNWTFDDGTPFGKLAE